MSPDEKMIWKKPELRSFANVEEAIAYYTEHGTPAHVEAVKRLAEEAKELEDEQRLSRRVVAKR